MKRSRGVDDLFRSEIAEVLPTRVQAPNANAFAERWVGTVRTECLDWPFIVGRNHLEQVLWVYAEHDNRHHPHRALGCNHRICLPGLPSSVRGPRRLCNDVTCSAGSCTNTGELHARLTHPSGWPQRTRRRVWDGRRHRNRSPGRRPLLEDVAIAASFQNLLTERRVGWQPSRFLTDRGEAERAFQLAEQLGSVNAAAQQLGTTWPSLRKAFTRHGLGMPTATLKPAVSGSSPPPPSAAGSRPPRPWTRCSWPSTPASSRPESGHRPSCSSGSAARSSTPSWVPAWWSSCTAKATRVNLG
jgi:hypothetical protein